MTNWVVTYSDDRELDLQLLNYEKDKLVRSGQLKFLKIGTGKVPAAVAVVTYLTSSLRSGRAEPPQVISVGTAVTTEPVMVGMTLQPGWAVDRDTCPDLMIERGLQPSPVIRLAESTGVLKIGSGGSFRMGQEEREEMQARDVHVMDLDSHAIGWATIRCLAGKTRAVRYVTHQLGSTPGDWEKTYAQARKELTAAVSQLTDEGTAA